jgi:hypothetical protein
VQLIEKYFSFESFYEQQVLSETATHEFSRDSAYRSYHQLSLARKGKKEDSDKRRFCLGHTILLSHCYFAIARFKRGNIVELG